MSKAARRARKKANKALKEKASTARTDGRCDGCGVPVPANDGNHDSAWSKNGVTFDGIAVTAWCRYCGSDTCS